MTPQATQIRRRWRPAVWQLRVLLGAAFAAEAIQSLLLTIHFPFSPHVSSIGDVVGNLASVVVSAGRYTIIVAILPIVLLACGLSLMQSVNRSVQFVLSILAILGELALLAFLMMVWLRWVQRPL